MQSEISFGDFIRNRRLSLGYVSLNQMAKWLNISSAYLSAMENGVRSAPKDETLEELSVLLKLTEDEKEHMLALAEKSRTYAGIPRYVIDYILTNKLENELKEIVEQKVTKSEFENLVKNLKENRNRQQGFQRRCKGKHRFCYGYRSEIRAESGNR